MDRTLSFKTTDETANWVDSQPQGRSVYLRELVERARQVEVDGRDLAIIAELDGDIADVVTVIDTDEWSEAATEWDGVDL